MSDSTVIKNSIFAEFSRHFVQNFHAKFHAMLLFLQNISVFF